MRGALPIAIVAALVAPHALAQSIEANYRFDTVDPNGDGVLTRAELRAFIEDTARREFTVALETLDTNDDLQLTLEEALAGNADPENTRREYPAFDLDGDGTVTIAEAGEAFLDVSRNAIGRGVEGMFAAADSDGDGLLTAQELPTINMTGNPVR